MFSLRSLPTIAACALLSLAAQAQTLPANFSDALVTNVSAPTALAFTPDGRMLIASQGGALRIFQNGALVATPALTFNPNSAGSEPKICTGGEQGLLGVAIDPQFATNNFVYLFYTARNGSNCGGVDYTSANAADGTPAGTYSGANRKANRVSRFVLGANNIVSPASETILVDRMPARGTNHNAGDLHFGKDGYLYISIGDGGTDYSGGAPGSGGGNDAARDRHVLTGKILRVTRDGDIPPDNPFQGAGTGRCNTTGATTPGAHCRETFAWGLRNPFRFAMDPNVAGTRFYINDVGQGAWEEIDESLAGADYGWNVCEGSYVNGSTSTRCSTTSGYTMPRFEYPHNTSTVPGTSVSNCNSITGGAFVPNGVWPSTGTASTNYEGTYLFADFVCGAIFKMSGTGNQTSAVAFVTSLGGSSATSLRFGPDGPNTVLYYTTYAAGGQIRKITYTANGNTAPSVANLVATPNSGIAPLNVTLSAQASDPNAGDVLTYFWDFGDGTTATTASASTNKLYNANGNYTVSVRVRDDKFAFSSTVTTTVQVGNTPPLATIASPTASTLFSVGQQITLTGSATDAQDGPLPPSALSWRVILHHDTHIHPFFGPQSGNNVQITAPPPEDLSAATNSYLEIELTATDSGGLTSVVRRDIQPLKRDLSVQSAPISGLKVNLNGTIVTTPQTVTVWAGWQLPVSVRDQNIGTNGYRFSTWTDGGERAHAYNSPNVNSTLTANFTAGAFVPSIDIDNNNAFDASTDGVLLLRYVFGLRGARLIDNAVGVGAERTTAPAIEGYIASVLSNFNIDGRPGVNAATDGMMIVRYLLNVSGTPLTNGTNSLNDSAQVKSALDALRP